MTRRHMLVALVFTFGSMSFFFAQPAGACSCIGDASALTEMIGIGELDTDLVFTGTVVDSAEVVALSRVDTDASDEAEDSSSSTGLLVAVGFGSLVVAFAATVVRKRRER